MKTAFKNLIAAAAFIAAGAASAATVTVTVGGAPYKNVTLSGTATWTLSEVALGSLDVYAPTLTSSAPGVLALTKDSDGFMTAATVTSPVTSLNVDDTTDQALSSATKGGLSIAVPARKAVSSGGSLTVTDLNVDLASKKVYATLVGANGVGTLTNVYLWDIETVTGNTAVVPPSSGSAVNTVTVSGLRLTTGAFTKIVGSLGLLNLGKAALQGVDSFGSIAITLNELVAPLPVCSVSFKTTNKNSTLFNTEVTLHNASSNATTGWKVNWLYDKPTLLVNVKNAKLTNKNFQFYTAQPVNASTTIPAGGSATFSFRGHGGGTAPSVHDLKATVGGQTCQVIAQ